MALTHICHLEKHGWRKITVEEASKKYPYGSSSYSGRFMCSLCGQYVTLTAGGAYVPYFRHSSGEADKSCPERVFGSMASFSFKTIERSLPVRIQFSTTAIDIQIGLIELPPELRHRKNSQIINIESDSGVKYQFRMERLNASGITYFSLGDCIASKYYISISGDDKGEYKNIWPYLIDGIGSGSLFDGTTHIRLTVDSDVEVNKKYFLLTRQKYIPSYPELHSELVHQSKVGWTIWYIYEIWADAITENTAKFFLDLRCRLTDSPIELIPLWPVTVESPYILHHKKDYIHFYFQGNEAEVKAYPDSKVLPKWFIHNHELVTVYSDLRQQLVSTGRTKVLKYTYIWKDPLSYKEEPVKTKITDLKNIEILAGEHFKLPYKNELLLFAEYDGHVDILENGHVVKRYFVKASESASISGVRYGQEIRLYVGNDCVWKALYKKNTNAKTKLDEQKVMDRLINSRGKTIPISHALGNIAAELSEYPLVVEWIRSSLREGKMSVDALRYIKELMR